MEITTWHIALFILWLMWTIKAIYVMIKYPDELFKEDPDSIWFDDDGYSHLYSYTPLTNAWILFHSFVVVILLLCGIIHMPEWTKVIFKI